MFRTKEDFYSSHPVCSKNADVAGSVATKKTESEYFNLSELICAHQQFVCAYCFEHFRQFQRINFHIKDCKGGPPFPCEFCTITFNSKKELTFHKTSLHSNKKPFRCPYCTSSVGAWFKLNSSLQKHLIKQHERPQNESYQCDRCPKRFIKKVYLTHHKIRFHNITKPFLCQTCGESLFSKASLKAHMRIHVPPDKGLLLSTTDDCKESTYQCNQCEKAFKRKDKLNFHTAVHTGKRPFVCHLCPRYSNNSILTRFI